MIIENQNEGELDKYINDLADINDDNSNVDDNSGANNGGDNNVDNNPNGANNNASNEQNTQVQDQNTVPVSEQQNKAPKKEGQQPNKSDKNAAKPELRPLGDGTFADARGNITDDSGKVIAESGFAARMYNTNRRLKSMVEERTNQLNEIAGTVGEYKALATSIKNYNLETPEVAQALDLAGRMKRGDYVGVAKEILALCAAQGYNVTDLLGGDVGDTIEMRAIQRMIDDRLAPITRQEQGREQQERATQAGRLAYQKFVSENEYADVHADTIASLAQRDGITVQTAYNRIYGFAAQNGLDFTKPLKPQLEARIAQQNKSGGQQQQNGGNAQTKPMPNGAATRTNGAIPQMTSASADDDWGSIIKQVQRTIGTA